MSKSLVNTCIHRWNVTKPSSIVELARNIYSIQDSIWWIEAIIFEIIPTSTSFALNHNMLVWSSTSLNRFFDHDHLVVAFFTSLKLALISLLTSCTDLIIYLFVY
ncbi:hypothetical protein HanIR_Chr10g0467701 [Helianthus annuus]|nr:hypothetical protein HanIR_Chr10g0467701 [Helianthus annuus]